MISWNAGFTAWLNAAQQSQIVKQYTQTMAEVLRSIVRALPDDGRALMISHGGIVEACAVSCLPTDTRFTDDAPCGYCEGVRLTFEGEAVVNLEMLRVEQPRV